MAELSWFLQVQMDKAASITVQGLETKVAENGSNFSVGECQLLHRPSGLHSHFRSRFGHEEGVLVTENYFVVDGNMIDFCPRYLLDF